MTARQRRALAHPAWWLALAVFVLNDHLFKHSRLAGWWTGKLSDLAGLVVAPVLVATLLQTKTARTRAAAFALVVVPFVAIKVSDVAASTLVRAMAVFGMRWRLWVDPTDLIALLVLPLAWRISDGRTISVARPTIERLATVLGAVACVATSEEFVRYKTAAYLLNAGDSAADVRIYRVATPLDCAAVSANPVASIRAESFAFERCRSLSVGSFLPLDVDWEENVEGDKSTPAPSRACDAVVVRVAGMPDTVVFWSGLGKIELTESRLDLGEHRDDPRALFLEQVGDRHVMAGTEFLQAWPLSGSLPDSTADCPAGP